MEVEGQTRSVTRLLKPRKFWEQCLARPGLGKINLGEKEATPHLPATCGAEKDTKVKLQGLGHSGGAPCRQSAAHSALTRPEAIEDSPKEGREFFYLLGDCIQS